MKKLLKGLMTVVIVFVFAIVLTGCGKEETNGGESTGGDNNEQETTGTKISDINTSNWEDVVKENFLLDVSLPSGWSIEEASSLNNYSNVELVFVPSEETTFEAFGETLFSKSKEVSTKQAPSVGSFQDSILTTGTSTWRYYPEIKNCVYVQINYFDKGSNVEITIQR